jgi:hypothetical protein
MVVNAAARVHAHSDNPNHSVRFADIAGMVAILRRSIVLIPHVLANALKSDVRQQANAERRTTDLSAASSGSARSKEVLGRLD